MRFGIATSRSAATGRLAGFERGLRAVAVIVLLAGSSPAAAEEPTTTTTVPVDTTTTTTVATTTTTVAPDTTTTTTVPPGTTTTTPTDASTTTTLPTSTTSTPAIEPAETAAPELDDGELDPEELEALKRLQGEYDELSANEARLMAEYVRRLNLVERLDLDIALLDVDIEQVGREVASARIEVARAEADVAANEARQRETEIRLADAIETLRRQAVDAYVLGDSGYDEALLTLVDTDAAYSAEVAMTYATVAVENRRVTVEDVRALEAELDHIGNELNVAKVEVDTARWELERLESQLDRRRIDLSGRRDEAETERLELERRIDRIRDAMAGYEQLLFLMDVESDTIAGILGRVQRGQSRAETIPLMRSPMDVELGARSDFGPRLHPIFGTVRQHNGIDLGAALGDPIRSIDAGVVVMAEARNGYGNTIVIDHGDKVASLYAHQSRFEVAVGDEVARGEVIGRIGSTGWSTGPHLHVEIRLAGRPVDPILYLLDNEPLDCQLLLASEHAIDQAVLAERDDC